MGKNERKGAKVTKYWCNAQVPSTFSYLYVVYFIFLYIYLKWAELLVKKKINFNSDATSSAELSVIEIQIFYEYNRINEKYSKHYLQFL